MVLDPVSEAWRVGWLMTSWRCDRESLSVDCCTRIALPLYIRSRPGYDLGCIKRLNRQLVGLLQAQTLSSMWRNIPVPDSTWQRGTVFVVFSHGRAALSQHLDRELQTKPSNDQPLCFLLLPLILETCEKLSSPRKEPTWLQILTVKCEDKLFQDVRVFILWTIFLFYCLTALSSRLSYS